MSQTEGGTIQGVEIPEPGHWQLDPAHTSVEFTARQFMASKVRRRFHGVSGNIHISEEPLGSWVAVTVDPASVETGNARRDEHCARPTFRRRAVPRDHLPEHQAGGRPARWVPPRG